MRLAGGGAQLDPVTNPSAVILDAIAPKDMRGGLVTVQVATMNNQAPLVGAVTPNQRVVLDVSWSLDGAGGRARIDATKGTQFTVGAADRVRVKASIESGDGGALVAGTDKRVEATARWGGASSPARPFFSGPRTTVVGGVPSAAQEIPECARSITLLSDTPASLGAVTIEFLTASGGGVWYRETGRLLPAQVASGAEFVRFTSAGGIILIPVWELWL